MTTTQDVLYGRQLGDFTLRDCIDEGGFGAVYLCEQPLLGREAVVKVMHARVQADEDARRRFSAEARLAARLDHPYVAHVYAFGIEEDGLVWIAMELVHGVSLKDYLDDHSSMSLDAFVPFFEQLAEVVHTAHEQGIVHRDLKPSNIMLCRGKPKLLDFGAAKSLTDSAREAAGLPLPDPSNQEGATQRMHSGGLTPPDALIGTPAYSSPEIWLGDSAGPAADVYALGIIAYEVLTGRRPFRADTFLAIGAAHLREEIPKVEDPELDAVFACALAKDPDDRYESAPEFAAALRGVLDGRHAALRAVLDGQRRRRAAQRMGAWIGALFATVVFGGAVGRSRYEQRIAEQRAADASEMAHRVTLTAEVEQGRAALLAGDMQGAQAHLGAAWGMGDRSRTTRFMLDRAMQPRRAELARLQGHGRMWSASWSPDGRYIATTDDQGAQIWDGTTYASLSPLPHRDTVYSAVWMGNERLVTACGDGSVRIWDAGRGSLVKELRVKGKDPRWYVVAVSGSRVAAIDAKGAIAAVWDADGGMAAEMQLGGDGWPSVAFSADGRWLAVSGGGSVRVVETAKWRRAVDVSERVRAIAWDPTGPRLLVGGAAGDASIWNVPSATRDAPRQLGETVTAVAFSSNGQRAAIAGEDGAERVFDATTGRIVSQGNHLHASVTSIAFSSDGARVVASGSSGEVTVVDARSGLPSVVLDGPHQQLGTVRFSSDGDRVLAASWDGTARLWNAVSSYRQWSAAAIGPGYGLVGGVVPDGRYLAIACPGCATRVWDTACDRMLAELPPLATGDRVPYPVVSPAGDRAAIARGGVAEVYELPGGRLLGAVKHAAPVTALAFTASSELVSGSADGVVLAGDRALATDIGAGIDALAALPDGRIVAADVSGRVRVLDGSSAIPVGIRARMLRPSPDSKRLLVVAYYSGKTEPMVLVNLSDGATTRINGPPAYTARWTSTGILSAHADGAARLWSADGELTRTYVGSARQLIDVDASPDGATIVGGGGDGMLRIWDATTGKPLWVVAVHKPYVMGLHFEGDEIVTRGIGGEVARWRISGIRGDRKVSETLPF